jgi:uncharacterized membrane protein HdeD (DUF308 family)
MMSTTDRSLETPLQTALGQLQQNWGWLLALGILFILLGTIGLGMLFTLTIASVLFFGVLLLIGGVSQLIQTFQCKGWKDIFWHILIGVLYVAAGIIVIQDPIAASALFTLMLAGALIAIGILRIIMALRLRGLANWFWTLLSGIVSLALGAMIVAHWPVSGLWVIGLFIAIEMIFSGWSYIIIALAAKNATAHEAG